MVSLILQQECLKNYIVNNIKNKTQKEMLQNGQNDILIITQYVKNEIIN